jgi:2-polyprenyl-6-methoxyphenol hydroxylase-like FAD-dependent oxidoreductase
MSRKHVVIVGGSVAGMATALTLTRQGHDVTLLEREALPDCDSAVDAFARWDRRGAPQTRHSHAFLARIHNRIKATEPILYQALLDAGAEPMPFSDLAKETFPDAELLPEDEEISLLACRRMTLDWVLRRHVERNTKARYREGVRVLSLLADPDDATGLPRVRGVRVRNAEGDEEEIAADLVVDASGRNTEIERWLAEIGAAPLQRDSESCGIFYCSRFYRLREGAEPPPMEGPIGADLGYMKYAIFQGDSHIFSITLAASPKDDALRRVREPEAFEAAAAALPSTRAWVDPAISEPITDVESYANLKNTLRHFTPEGRPLALGLFPIGDALLHANPISGRGCTLAWIGAELLGEALEAHPDDALAFAAAMHESVQRELVPWYLQMRDQDRANQDTSRIESEGGDPFSFQRPDGTVDPKAYLRSLMRDGFLPALREDISVLRAFMRVFNMLEPPADILATPGLMQRVLAVWQQRAEREPLHLGPRRAEMIAQIDAAAA